MRTVNNRAQNLLGWGKYGIWKKKDNVYKIIPAPFGNKSTLKLMVHNSTSDDTSPQCLAQWAYPDGYFTCGVLLCISRFTLRPTKHSGVPLLSMEIWSDVQICLNYFRRLRGQALLCNADDQHIRGRPLRSVQKPLWSRAQIDEANKAHLGLAAYLTARVVEPLLFNEDHHRSLISYRHTSFSRWPPLLQWAREGLNILFRGIRKFWASFISRDISTPFLLICVVFCLAKSVCWAGYMTDHLIIRSKNS